MIIGIILIACGMMIAFYPPLLAIIVAAFLIFLGLVLVVVSTNYKKMKRHSNDPFIEFFMRF